MTEHTPFLISWNITPRCNLRCPHCYLDSTELEGGAEGGPEGGPEGGVAGGHEGTDEVTTDAARRFIDEIASLNPHAMLILTGGEPLLRRDIGEISSYASARGLTVFLGTNGTLLDDEAVEGLVRNGVKGVGISIDSVKPSYHDRFRGLKGAWKRAIEGIDALKRHGVDFQLQITVTRENILEIPRLVDLAHKKGAQAVNIFFLVCTGRGQGMTDVTPGDYDGILTYIVEAEKAYEGRMMVRAKCAPHVLRVAESVLPESGLLRGETSGCIAGTGYLRISPGGYVTPCAYMPVDSSSPNLNEVPLKQIWEETAIFRTLRSKDVGGRCGACEFNGLCGGCRARALATSGDIMGEDPWCTYKPAPSPVPPRANKPAAGEEAGAVWTGAALERLEQVPVFLRPMVRSSVERYAKTGGLTEITPEVMAKLRKRIGR